MQIGTFRRNVGKTLGVKPIKLALRTVSKNTTRTLVAQGAVTLKGDTGRLLQVTAQYVLGLPMTQETKDEAFRVLGDVGADLAALSRVLKVKLPSATKKAKLVGTRAAALLQVDSLATDLVRQASEGLFVSPKMTTVTRMVSMPQKGGAKEERTGEVVDSEAEAVAEAERQTQMKSFLTGAIDVYWRLCLEMTGQPPAAVLEAKILRLKAEHPTIAFDTETKKPKAKTAEAVPA